MLQGHGLCTLRLLGRVPDLPEVPLGSRSTDTEIEVFGRVSSVAPVQCVNAGLAPAMILVTGQARREHGDRAIEETS